MSTELLYWLALINESGLKLNTLKPMIQRWCLDESRPLSELLTLSRSEWAATFNLSDPEANLMAAVPDKLDRQAQTLAAWQDAGIEPLTYLDPRYPQRLKHGVPQAQQPLILWAQGAVELLNGPSVALLSCQTDITPTDEERLQLLATEHISLLSGYGRGFERLTFEAMLGLPDGQAIVVLPMGISAFHQTTPKLSRAKGSQRVLLVSPFAPEMSFQPKFAEARYRLVDYLATVLLALQVDDSLMARLTQALQADLSLFMVDDEDSPQPATLFEQGALPLTDAAELIEMVQQGLIDVTMSQVDAFVNAPTSVGSSMPADEGYALTEETIEPLRSDEALDILSSSGNIPPILRQRLESSSS